MRHFSNDDRPLAHLGDTSDPPIPDQPVIPDAPSPGTPDTPDIGTPEPEPDQQPEQQPGSPRA